MRMLSLLFLSLIVIVGCKEEGSPVQPLPAVFRVDLQQGFQDDYVRVSVDNRFVFEGRVTTDHILSLARSLSVDAGSGPHDVLVRVLSPYPPTENDTTVVVKDTLTVAVNLDRGDRKMSFALYPFLIPYR